jgi:hypothetical protein
MTTKTRLEVETEAYRVTNVIADRDITKLEPELWWTRMDALRAFVAGYRFAGGQIDDTGFRTGIAFSTIPEIKE